VEQLVTPLASDMGSWVSLAHVEDNRFVASDQYGKIYRVEVPEIGSTSLTSVEQLEVEVGKAQGLLWAYHSLYVLVNDQDIENSGLYRITDTDQDGQLDKVDFLYQMDGWGEHGPHGVTKGPDGLIYMIAGNHTKLPEKFTSVAPPIWDEDRLFESIKDPNGHANKIKAPGGWIARTDSIGSYFEVYSSGYRNAYDIAFNEDGELFTFDSDMEWDFGLPWYRPVRVCHVTSGSEYGWRTGSGKWPTYYPDNLPGIVDIGQGSPTGVVSAINSNFPAPFNTGLFVCDWSFGTMYHVALDQDGGTYSGNYSEFLSGVPLPLTDVTFGAEGAMYFTTGGRRLTSSLYRVWSTDNGEQPSAITIIAEMKLRRELERFHDQRVDANTELVWENLGHDRREIRFAARIAMENQGIGKWGDEFNNATDAVRLIEFGIAAARTGNADLKELTYKKIAKINTSKLSDDQKLGLIRAQGLLIIKQANLDITLIEPQWKNEFPSDNVYINEELANLFVASTNPTWLKKLFVIWQNAEEVDRTIMISDEVASRHDGYGKDIMNAKKRKTSAHKIALMDAMSRYTVGWTVGMQKEYYQGFNSLWDREGGNSYRGFILAILDCALASVPNNLRTDYRKISGAELGEYGRNVLADLPVPEGPGQNWSVDQIEELMSSSQLKANFKNGQKMYEAALCKACHAINGAGSNIGPELSQLGTRFSIRDIAISLVDPNLAVSDQYMVTNYNLKDGTVLRGKTVKIQNDTAFIMTNPLKPEHLRRLPVDKIEKEEKSNHSIMFPALLNRLNEQEVFDLMTFLLAGSEEN